MAPSPVPQATGPGRSRTAPDRASTAEAAELAEVRAQLREAQETIEAIRAGGVDSLVIGRAGQEQFYSLASVDRTYRLLVGAMNEGAATVSPRGVILDANPRLGSMAGQPAGELTGTAAADLIPRAQRATFARLLDIAAGGSARGEMELARPDGTTVPILLAVSGFDLDGMLLRCLVLTDLTAQRTAESQSAAAHEALREQSTFLEQAQASAGLGWWVLDPQRGDMLTWSPEAYRIYGLTPGQFDGKSQTLEALVHPDDAPGVSGAFAASLEDGVSFHIEHRIIRPDGGLRWVLLAAVVHRDDAGVPTRVMGICQDITDRKRSETEIRAGAAYNRSLIEASLDPLVMIGPDGTITDVNAAIGAATGFARDELLGTEFSGYFTEPSQARAVYERVFRDGSALDHPLELRHRDGHTTPVLYNASVYRDPSGKVLGVFAAARDITQIKRTEAALRESEERLRALFDNAPVGIEDVALNGELVRVNPRLCEITGYTADELCRLRVQDITHPDDLDADMANLQRLSSGEIDTFSLEKRHLRKDGGVVWVEATRALVRDPEGNPMLFVGAVRDITAQRDAEAEVSRLNADLEARVERRTADLALANKNLEAFGYSVSHDLRAPLRALSGYSEALLEEYSDHLDETGRGYAGRIQAASERMATLIDDLLQLARVSRSQMHIRPVDLSAEVAAVVGEFQSADPGRQIRISIQDGVWATADRGLIRTVLQNLVENAWKFTARQENPAIEFGSMAAGDAEICYFVRDNGAGFDPAHAAKLFEPFERLHTDTDFAGTGIGLASVQRIIERHGGRIWAESQVGTGATFYFTLDASHAS